MKEKADWKIYTRQGDHGETSLAGGTRVPKYHLRVECYGTMDELNSIVGMLRDQQETASYRKELLKIQETLFLIEAHLATPGDKGTSSLPKLRKQEITSLEKSIDKMDRTLPALTNFILPGGHPAVSWAHIARTVCRRTERLIIRLSEQEQLDPLIIPYLNRLSDYLFVLARRLGNDLGTGEICWKP